MGYGGGNDDMGCLIVMLVVFGAFLGAVGFLVARWVFNHLTIAWI